VDFSNPEHSTAVRFCVVGDVVFNVKRQDLILKAFRKLPSSSSELHFYGGGPDLDALKELCKKSKNAFVHGRVTNKEVLQLLPNYHAHIQFSAFETFGIATLEARKAGIWAISRASFGCSDYADKGLFMAESVEELTKKLSEVIALSKPDVNKFEALSKAEIGHKIQLCYNKLN
jgi:glycosyltransferase involved in cell wall biosynthesis